MSLVKTKTIDFRHVNDVSNAQKYADALRTQNGVIEAEIDSSKGQLNIRYNLKLINMEKIEQLLAGQGYQWPNSFWQRTKRNWAHYTEQNELDNANVPDAPCCSHPDEMLAKAKRNTH